MPFTYERLHHPTGGEFDQIKLIFDTNFAPHMQKPFAMLTTGCQDGTITLLVVRDGAGGPILGAATLTPLPDLPTLYLGYFVVDQHRHNQGIGSEFFRFMVDFINQHFEHNALVWDVEGVSLDDPAHLNSRRIRFYERLGAQVVTLAPTYRMPLHEALDPNGSTFPLRLMWLPLRGRTASPDKTEVSAWISAIHTMFYPDHRALLDQILAELGA